MRVSAIEGAHIGMVIVAEQHGGDDEKRLTNRMSFVRRHPFCLCGIFSLNK